MNNFEQARDLLTSDLRKYLIGPAEGEEEIIPERASDRYHVGSLAPSGTIVSQEEDDADDSADASGAEGKSGDGVLALANAAQQSAVGFTFQVPTNRRVLIDVSWADYIAVADKKSGTVSVNGSQSGDHCSDGAVSQSASTSSWRWRRSPHVLNDIVLPLQILDKSGSEQIASDGDISLELHERVSGNLRIVTVSLVNRRPRPDREKRREQGVPPEDANIYQVSLSIRSEDGSKAFVSRSSSEMISDPEFLVHELLYRNVRQYAVGHGCATDWSPDGTDASVAKIWSDWLPTSEVFKASSRVESLDGSTALDVAYLASAQRKELIEELGALPNAYASWIAGLRSSLDEVVKECDSNVASRIRGVATKNLDACERVNNRIREGIALIASDDHVFCSFALANAAMEASMRIARPMSTPLWRPFQLAFLLLAMPSTASGDHPERLTLDLIWFPTGGGKTEAYLGLVAFTLFHRRLSASNPRDGGGTAVITRYTLRLLTMQQFERAARTVMACEVLRRKDPAGLGSEPFSIGLFVGNGVTPGDLATAQRVLEGTNEDKSLATLPVTKCPWCSEKIRSNRDQTIDRSGLRVVTRCHNQACDFQAGLPIACVDEELFAHPPSMIIGTVDKFAMMAWEPRIGRLFGRPNLSRPPSLIIQDELHLIGDALGSITGLYETAVDLLCSENGVQPKIVGSTATIRRARAQSHSVFLREVAQFPPNGLNYDDSFFYREDRSNAGRVYMGVHAQGRSPKHTLARLIGILGQGAMSIKDKTAQDHYWTLVTYFNSLRELGGAWVLGLDDVPKYIKAMPAKQMPDRRLGEPTELTSHLPSTAIPGVLERIAASRNSDDDDRETVDLLLCTNMISVGVDIDRLGLMIVNGQPKTTAEYIQATSRVGRPEGAAGLVVTLYNWTRPRDRSHYERFRSYHESFYRNVEATSATPFSMRARDRGLHGVFVSLMRLTIPQLADSPMTIDDPAVKPRVALIMSSIVDRAQRVSGSEDVAAEVLEELEYIRDKIRAVAEMEGVWHRGSGVRVLRRPNEARGVGGGIETPQSMRDVDPPCAIELKSLSS
ncbi:helicase-related protein [Dyella humicola]|uniref:helicase-related protein n=1 Tax=Dyella humicola TaxID=2992126 RepID=UPI0022575D6A|nr:helicase-related protein [Dyella humicola]